MAIMDLSFLVSFALFAMCLRSSLATDDPRKVHIVYMGSLPSDPNYSPTAHHTTLLQEVVQTSNAEQSLTRSYTKSFNGFAANLTDAEAKKLSAKEEVVSVFPSRTLQLHTTESWNFMGFTDSAPRNYLTCESDIVVGVLDTGIWPESKSFRGHGFGPIPEKWKGACNGGQNFTCNKKLIGARSLVLHDTSCRDMEGHGSHTSSTAAGNHVKNVSFYGLAKGTARGGVPGARIAMYKVCVSGGCEEHAILSGFDHAIADGVDVLSVSLGRIFPSDITEDTVAIGSFHASQKGILTVQSAGNEGPDRGRITSNAPWLFSVAASTIDRKFITKVRLGNGKFVEGFSVNAFEMKGKKIPVVYGGDASKTCTVEEARMCKRGCLDKLLVKGKIVMCESFQVEEVYDAGGVGWVLLQDGSKAIDYAIVTPYPLSVLKSEQFELAKSYYNSTKDPTMKILFSYTAKDPTAPKVVGFSGRGPNRIIPNILKPDITAPGVDILAAFSPAGNPSGYEMDKRHVSYNILSGTSMSCPHVTGAAAYVKSLHPTWSHSAIKSALMTSASIMKREEDEDEDNEFSYGAGHLDPIKASNPGIVYETDEKDYIRMLCGMNLSTPATISKMFSLNISCGHVHDTIDPKDLNYPSMTTKINDTAAERFNVEFPRKVTNVGAPSSTYKATVTCNQGGACDDVVISVEPDTLVFKKLNEQKSFVVKVSAKMPKNIISASLEWSDGTHTARSPIVVYTKLY